MTQDQLDRLCESICEADDRWLFAVRQRNRLNAALGAHIRHSMGWNLGLPEGERKAIERKTREFIKAGLVDYKIHCALENNNTELAEKLQSTFHPPEGYKKYAWAILGNAKATDVFDGEAEATLYKLEDLAEQLPVWNSFAKDIRGFGPKSLATIVAEAGGSLSNYIGSGKKPTSPSKGYGKLLKRLGIACIGGIAQGKLPSGTPKELWIEHGYNKARRARIYVIGDCLVKANREGPYRTHYDQRKELERQRAKERGLIVAPAAKIPAKQKDKYVSDGVIHLRAQRHMETKLVVDLWRAWRRAA